MIAASKRLSNAPLSTIIMTKLLLTLSWDIIKAEDVADDRGVKEVV